jgi:formylglycine-generating enzyme required for sulfatase activity
VKKRCITYTLSVSGIIATILFLPSFPATAQLKTYTNSIGMEFVLIPAGSFMMGTPYPNCPKDDPFTETNEYEECREKVSSDETPQHKVTISKPFYMGKYEVTQEEWYKIMGNNPSEFKSEKVGGDSRRHPVEQISWNIIKVFIRKLNQKEGVDKYRLPTEAEWEYSCRAGSTGRYCFGDSEKQLSQYAWYGGAWGTHPVGQLKSNAWGLYDMHGNVWEWVQDWEKSYSEKPMTDPKGPSSGDYRIYRGGGWSAKAEACCSARRFMNTPDRQGCFGFRLVLTP